MKKKIKTTKEEDLLLKEMQSLAKEGLRLLSEHSLAASKLKVLLSKRIPTVIWSVNSLEGELVEKE